MIEAATKIQAVYRGFKTRSELKQVTKFTIKNFNKLFFKILLFQKTNEITNWKNKNILCTTWKKALNNNNNNKKDDEEE